MVTSTRHQDTHKIWMDISKEQWEFLWSGETALHRYGADLWAAGHKTVNLLPDETATPTPHIMCITGPGVQKLTAKVPTTKGTTASRQSGALFKHSFHIVFPTIGFHRNNGALKKFVQSLAALPQLQGYDKDGQPMPIVDSKVYSRNQVFRLTESWKFNPAPESGMVLEFWPLRDYTMEHLLSSVVSNVRHVRVWLPELGKEASPQMVNLLHGVGIDNLCQESETGYVTMFTPYCPCSSLSVQHLRSTYTLESRGGDGYLICQDDSCVAINAQSKLLDRVNSEILCRYRAKVSTAVLTQVLQDPRYEGISPHRKL